MNLKAEGTLAPIPKRVILPRPITATASIGLRGSAQEQGQTVCEAIRLIAAGHDPCEVCEATGLDADFLVSLAALFWSE